MRVCWRNKKVAQNKILSSEAKEIENVIHKDVKERPNFWKLWAKIKEKKPPVKKIKDNEGVIQTDEKKIAEVKRRYYEELYKKPEVT